MKAVALLMICLCILGAVVLGFGSSEPWIAIPLLALALYWIVQYRRFRRQW